MPTPKRGRPLRLSSALRADRSAGISRSAEVERSGLPRNVGKATNWSLRLFKKIEFDSPRIADDHRQMLKFIEKGDTVGDERQVRAHMFEKDWRYAFELKTWPGQLGLKVRARSRVRENDKQKGLKRVGEKNQNSCRKAGA